MRGDLPGQILMFDDIDIKPVRRKSAPKPPRPRPEKDPLERVKEANDTLSVRWGEAYLSLGDSLSEKFRELHISIAKQGVVIAEEIRKMKGT